MKNTIIKGFMVLAVCAAIVSCGKGKDEPLKEKYCGLEISAFDVIALKKIGDKGYTFSDDDNKLAADMMAALKGLFDNKYDIQIGFIERNADKIGLYVITPDDQKVVEKVSCYLLENDFDGRLPKTRNLLFYTPDHNTLLAAVKTK